MKGTQTLLESYGGKLRVVVDYSAGWQSLRHKRKLGWL